jgi:hypothetical protein
MSYNELELHEDTYIIMQDVDRYNDAEYTTAAEAEEAMLAIGDIEMWVGRVERINDQLEIMFVCGESA